MSRRRKKSNRPVIVRNRPIDRPIVKAIAKDIIPAPPAPRTPYTVTGALQPKYW